MKNIIGQLKKMSKKRWWLLGLTILIVSGVGIYFMSRPAVKEVESIQGESLAYTVASKTTNSCWAVVKTDYIPSEVQLKATAFKVWKDDEKMESVFLYLPEMNTGAAAYGIARFIPRGMAEFRINTSALKDTKWQ